MGFLRKTILVSTGGLAPIKANSKKERIAKAAEKQVRLQQEALKQQQTRVPTPAPAPPPPQAPAAPPTLDVPAASALTERLSKLVIPTDQQLQGWTFSNMPPALRQQLNEAYMVLTALRGVGQRGITLRDAPELNEEVRRLAALSDQQFQGIKLTHYLHILRQLQAALRSIRPTEAAPAAAIRSSRYKGSLTYVMQASSLPRSSRQKRPNCSSGSERTVHARSHSAPVIAREGSHQSPEPVWKFACVPAADRPTRKRWLRIRRPRPLLRRRRRREHCGDSQHEGVVGIPGGADGSARMPPRVERSP